MDPDTIYEEETVELNTENTDSEGEVNEVVVGEEEEVAEQHLDEVLIMDNAPTRRVSQIKPGQTLPLRGGNVVITRPGLQGRIPQTIKILPTQKGLPATLKNIKMTNVPGQIITHQTVPIKRKLEGSPMIVRLDKRMRFPSQTNSPIAQAKQVKVVRSVTMQTEVTGDIMEQYQQIIEEDQQKIALLEDQIKKLKYTPEMFENDDKRTEYFTGLDTFVTMITLFNTCEAELPLSQTLTKFEIFILTLLKLRLKLPLPFLGYLFGISAKAANYFYNECLGILHNSLREVFSETMEMVEVK